MVNVHFVSLNCGDWFNSRCQYNEWHVCQPMRLYAVLWRIFRRTHRPCSRPWSTRSAAFDGRKTHICGEKWLLTGDKQGWGKWMTVSNVQRCEICILIAVRSVICALYMWRTVGLALLCMNMTVVILASCWIWITVDMFTRAVLFELFSNLIFVLLFQLHQVLGDLRQGRAGSTEATVENWGA